MTHRAISFAIAWAILLGFCVIPGALHARSFTSSLNLKVFEYGFGLQPDRYLGATSSKKANQVDVPSHDYWYVQPVGTLNEKTLMALSLELKKQKIPGVDLSSHWDVNDQSLAWLAEYPGELRLLILTHTRVTDKGLGEVPQWSGLKYLVLNKQTTDAGLQAVQKLKNLEYLYLHRAKITDDGTRLLKDLSKLRGLDLGGTRITDASAKTLGGMRSLRQLDINDTAVTDHGVAALAPLTQLQTLYVPANLTDAGVKSLTSFKKLEVLDMSGTAISNAGAAALTALTSLEELALSGTRIDDGALKSIAQLKRLKTLELSFTGITPEGLPTLLPLKKLRTLSLSWGKLSESDLRVLSQLPSVKTVILNGEVIPPDVLARITSLAKINAERAKRAGSGMGGAARPLAGVAPAAHPGAKGGVGATEPLSSRERGGLKGETPAPSRASTLPTDVIVPQPPRVATAGDTYQPQNKAIEIEVGASRPAARPSRTALTGLKRIHSLEVGGPKEPDFAPGAAKKIVHPEENAASLGEINIEAR